MVRQEVWIVFESMTRLIRVPYTYKKSEDTFQVTQDTLSIVIPSFSGSHCVSDHQLLFIASGKLTTKFGCCSLCLIRTVRFYVNVVKTRKGNMLDVWSQVSSHVRMCGRRTPTQKLWGVSIFDGVRLTSVRILYRCDSWTCSSYGATSPDLQD